MKSVHNTHIYTHLSLNAQAYRRAVPTILDVLAGLTRPPFLRRRIP